MKTFNIVILSVVLFYCSSVYAAGDELSSQVNENHSVETGGSFTGSQLFAGNSLFSRKAKSHELYAGFYPLIESTGYVPKKNTVQFGFNQISYSVFDKFNISLEPMIMVANTPNLSVKGLVYEDSKNSIAVNSGVKALLPNTDGFFSIYYSSRIHNPDSTLYVLPLSLAHSYKLNQHISFHHTITDINVLSRSDFKNKANLAYSTIVQLKAREQHSLMIHASEVGFWDHDYYYFGVSYRFTGKYFYTQMGYFNRVQQEGVQGIPLVDFGIVL